MQTNTLKKVIKVDESKCVNCHACITTCPVKYCNDGSKSVIQINSDMCIACGSCIAACTHSARVYIDDFSKFIDNIIAGEKIIVITAPAVAVSFPDMYLKLNTWLKQLGVEAVFDVSFGAELTVKSYIEYLKTDSPKTVISQPCPAIVSYIELYQPELIPNLAPVDSPMLHTVKMIKEFYPKYKDYKIAVISPCIAKKREFEDTGMCDYNIAHLSILGFLDTNNIDLNTYVDTNYDNPESERAVLFSSPGGLLKTVERWTTDLTYQSRKIEGVEVIYNYLKGLPEVMEKGMSPKLIDCLNCDFGCNAGPLTPNVDKNPDLIEYQVNKRAKQLQQKYLSKNNDSIELSKIDIEKIINKHWKPNLYNRSYINRKNNAKILIPTDSELQVVYYEMNKFATEDIKNCSSCGYGTCKAMAVAIFNKLNLPKNCHFYLTKEKEKAEYELINLNNELEQRVKARTFQLSETVGELKTSQEMLKQNVEEQRALIENIKEQKDEISLKEHRLNSLIHNMAEGFGITNFNENFIFSNIKACEIFNVKKDGLVGRNLKEFVEDDEWNRLIKQTELRKQNVSNSYDLKIKLENNIDKTIIVSTVPDYNIRGKIVGTIATFVDITNRRKEKNELKNINIQLKKYFTAIEQSPVIIIFTDISGKIEYVNNEFTKSTNYTFNEVIGKNPSILKSGKVKDETYKELWETVLAGKIWNGELINKTKNGRIITEKTVVSPIKNKAGKIINFVALKEDITELKKTELALKDSQTKYKAVLTHLDDVYYRTDINNKITLLSPSALQYTNYKNTNEIIGKDVTKIFYFNPDDRIALLLALKENNGKIINYEILLKDKENNAVPFETNSHFIYDKTGEIVGIEGILRNITEQKANELKIKLSEEKYRILFEDSNDAILMLGENKFIDCNSAAVKMFECKNKRDFLLIHPSKISPEKQPDGRLSLEKADEMIAIALKKGLNKFEWIHKKISGKEFPAEVWLTAIPYNKTTAIHAVIRDLTELKEKEHLLKLQKNKIELAHKNTTDSINYAKTIQQALLTSEKLIDKYLKNYFIVNKPKDKVSGDFYYVNKIDNNIVIAVADCTGHGVSGAFMTIIGITYLHEIISRSEIKKPNQVLNVLRLRIKETFMTFGSENDNGLDIALCIINKETNILQYAGAYNPLIIIRDQKIISYKGTKNPIGFYPKEIEFKNNKIQLNSKDVIYLFSDGYQDQFGKKDEIKFMFKNFKQTLYNVHLLPMIKQKTELERVFEDWKGNNEQTDDVIILGFEYTN